MGSAVRELGERVPADGRVRDADRSCTEGLSRIAPAGRDRELVDVDPRDFRRQAGCPVAGQARRLGLAVQALAGPRLVAAVRRFVGRSLVGGWAISRRSGPTRSDPTRPRGLCASSRFWFESFQNWQSEFLSVAVMVWLAVYLRQRGRPSPSRCTPRTRKPVAENRPAQARCWAGPITVAPGDQEGPCPLQGRAHLMGNFVGVCSIPILRHGGRHPLCMSCRTRGFCAFWAVFAVSRAAGRPRSALAGFEPCGVYNKPRASRVSSTLDVSPDHNCGHLPLVQERQDHGRFCSRATQRQLELGVSFTQIECADHACDSPGRQQPDPHIDAFAIARGGSLQVAVGHGIDGVWNPRVRGALRGDR